MMGKQVQRMMVEISVSLVMVERAGQNGHDQASGWVDAYPHIAV